MKSLIVYDLDGTLADTREDIVISVNHMRRVLGHEPLDAGSIRKHVGQGMAHLIKNCLGTSDMKLVEKGGKIYRAYYAEHMMDHTVLYPGVREALDYFKDRRQAVITNKPNPFTRDMLEALGVTHYFSDIVAGDSGVEKKPSPEAILTILRRENIPAGDALFVGDSLVDIETGRNAGVEVVVVPHGFTAEDELKSASPDALVSDFRAFLALARAKGW